MSHKVVMVHVRERTSIVDEDSFQEFTSLLCSVGVNPVASLKFRIRTPNAASCLGSGAVSEVGQVVHDAGAQMVYVNHTLSPVQQRNLEKAWGVKVTDRSGLILEIFARRAQTHEGKLQVELAQLQYQATRLVRGWTHLERQKGGIGLRGGPGETQLEIDRRMILNKVTRLKQKLKRLESGRALRRRSRRRWGVCQVSLVGYTNAGKSTLFNALTGAKVYAKDLLFATLDPTLRRIFIEPGHTIVLSDTVGFIRDLPHTLVAAFHATLEEVAQADLLLHVVDVSAPNADTQISDVNKVLKEIGADHVPQIMVWNKCDKTEHAEEITRDAEGRISALHVSSITRMGFAGVRSALQEFVERASNAFQEFEGHQHEVDYETDHEIELEAEYETPHLAQPRVKVQQDRLSSDLQKPMPESAEIISLPLATAEQNRIESLAVQKNR